MAILRLFLLRLAQSAWLKKFVTKFPLAKRVARRFVAGETLSDAIEVAKDLRRQGLLVSLDLLGENVHTAEEASRAAQDYSLIVDLLENNRLESNVSLKLTQLGLDLGSEVCLDNLYSILDRAQQNKTFVRIDMEGSEYTERTMEVFEKARQRYDNVGIVIQAYLKRSLEDVRRANRLEGQVRLCKGAYAEPPRLALQSREDVNQNFIELMKELMRYGHYPAIASHDEAMIAAVLDYVEANQLDPSHFEFQMLYGIRRDRQMELLTQGYNVRVYVPYGTEWYPYFMRRLAERPANLFFFLTALFKG